MLIFDPAPLLGALLLALATDAALGDPQRLYRHVPHPVVLIGRALGRLEAAWLKPDAAAVAQRRAGTLAALLVIGASALAGVLVHAVCAQWTWGWVPLGLLMSTLIAARGLHDHVARVAAALDQSLAAGRREVAHIVGRDPESLDQPGIARAAIESTAENFADGVTAPVVFGLLLGLPGMLACKAINTADSMIGHRSPRHLHFGRFAARLDDAANWLPARLSGLLLIAAAALLPTYDAGRAWRAMWRDAGNHRSPNAGWPEAAMAGALGVRLAGPRRYAGHTIEDAWMGRGRAGATSADVRRALRLLIVATVLLGALIALALFAAAA